MSVPVKRLLPVAEVADVLGCCRKHAYNLIAAGLISTVQIGVGRAKTRVHEDELARFIASQTTKARRPA